MSEVTYTNPTRFSQLNSRARLRSGLSSISDDAWDQQLDKLRLVEKHNCWGQFPFRGTSLIRKRNPL